MRKYESCISCRWYEDKKEDFQARFVSAHGLCHYRMPASVAKDSGGWGSWHQKGPAGVRETDWCSSWVMKD